MPDFLSLMDIQTIKRLLVLLVAVGFFQAVRGLALPPVLGRLYLYEKHRLQAPCFPVRRRSLFRIAIVYNEARTESERRTCPPRPAIWRVSRKDSATFRRKPAARYFRQHVLQSISTSRSTLAAVPSNVRGRCPFGRRIHVPP